MQPCKAPGVGHSRAHQSPDAARAHSAQARSLARLACLPRGIWQGPAVTVSCCAVVLCSQVASSFSHMLNLHNLSEDVNASQTERAVRLGEVRPEPRQLPQYLTEHAHTQAKVQQRSVTRWVERKRKG